MRAGAAVLAAMLVWPAVIAAQPPAVGPFPSGTRYDPRFDFRTVTVGRFDIHYHGDVETLARRLASIVEPVAAEIDARLGAPRGRIQVILVDQNDQANGWATILPYNMIELTAAPPSADSEIGNTDDWLRLVFAHEYAHVVHLEKSRGWLGSLRHVFGRLPLFYANLTLPTWQIEGLATLEESAVTGRGRVPAGDFRMLIEQAAAAGRFEPLGRASQPITDWPGGAVPYLYGAYFHAFLVERYGQESIARLTEASARRLPYFGAPAFREVYGRSLGELWGEFWASVLAAADARPSAASRERLTTHGYSVSAPAVAGSRIFYSVANPDGFPAILEWRGDDRPPRHVTTRFGGRRLSVSGNLLVFDQLEFVRNAGLQSDLYAVPMDGGRVRRLTREARAADPDVSPDGGRIVMTIQEPDRRSLAVMPMPAGDAPGQPLAVVSEAAVLFTSPRWAPDGRRVVAERQALHGPSEIVIVDVETGRVEPIVSSRPARNVTPAWTRDGAAVIFASDSDGEPFTLFQVSLATREVTKIDGAGVGAQSPVVAPDNSAIVFVGYTADGYDLFKLPAAAPRVRMDAPTTSDASAPATEAARTLDSRPYRPWDTLTPRFWTPVLQGEVSDLTIGAATGGYDALGRHAWFATTGWSVEHARGQFDLEYAYTRWRPTLFAALSDRVETWRRGSVRTLDVDAGVLFPVRRVRWGAAALVSLHSSRDTFECLPCNPAVDATTKRRSVRAGWLASNARQYSRSISAEEGGAVSMIAEWTRRALGADGDAGALIVEGQAYRRVVGRRDVLAIRLASGTTWGEAPSRRVLSASGNGAQAAGLGVGSDAIGLLRGIGRGILAGNHAAVANIDYRFPLRRVERGVGTVPVMLRTVHAAVFADHGAAWDDDAPRRVQRSYGAELSVDAVFGYGWPLTFTAGAAWRDGPGASGWAAFTRLGRAF